MLIILNLVLLFKVSAILIQVNGDDVVTDGEPIASPQIRFIYPFWLRPIYNSFNYEPPSQDSAAGIKQIIFHINVHDDDVTCGGRDEIIFRCVHCQLFSLTASRDLSDTSYYHSSRPAEPQFPPGATRNIPPIIITIIMHKHNRFYSI